MSQSHYILLFVDSPEKSAGFYTDLLGSEPIEASPTFAMFALSPGLMLGLWSRHTAEPKVTASPGASEVAFSFGDEEAVLATYTRWTGRGVAILQKPTTMDFGVTFTALDPDGHRLRVFAPAGA
ncbi:VOC family protein [Microvirga puerhi]|uniref:VOC family protein n=1 Tax=Microvirga puerhi TaxID=2876078 RepID=A0ABS7VR76_9HYPH|nr:VOC family protein [Microvirga puerhi]MBZ6077656.1 VOC family protein [Microvirga puerhi]